MYTNIPTHVYTDTYSHIRIYANALNFIDANYFSLRKEDIMNALNPAFL